MYIILYQRAIRDAGIEGLVYWDAESRIGIVYLVSGMLGWCIGDVEMIWGNGVVWYTKVVWDIGMVWYVGIVWDT